MKSKEEIVLQLFFDYPTKEWHFEDICKETVLARSKVDNWLKKLLHEKIIRRIKNKGRMPHYISNYESPQYKNTKKMFAMQQLHRSGLLNHLASLTAKTVILFGSFARSDWHKNSDIDVFVYGKPEGLNIGKYERKTGRNIQVFLCRSHKELHALGTGLIKNIIKGNIIKGDIDFVKVQVNA